MSCIFKAGGGLYPRMRVGAILLADRPSAALPAINPSAIALQGVPLLKRALIALSGAGVDEVVVVLGHDAERLDQLVCEFPVTVTCHPNYGDGVIHAVRAGLTALTGPFNALLVCHANQPLLNAQDLQGLIGAFKKSGAKGALVPQVKGRYGSPIIMDWITHDTILANGDDFGSDRFVERNHVVVTSFETDNDHYIVAIETREDIRALEARLGLTLKLPEPAAMGVAA